MTLRPDFSDRATLEKYSSAFSLSDMEIFVFPDLLYPLVLANIMSPIIWKWRDDPWFSDIERKSFTYKINRIKQYIMDHYVFNLDLDTWGLTTKAVEMDRFRDFVDLDILRQSNALFGYEGDKYYFDINIRRHFGLDKYTSDTIPYWKTETVEAMTAFKYRESFSKGAGECVSFSALYAAALFIVGRIPLEHIFLISTPLHSQNFIDIHEGVLTNNRRIVTSKMWFNGTPLSTRARRALEKEKVTIVSHISGYIHIIFDNATIDPVAYDRFSDRLRKFLTMGFSSAAFINFLRYHMDFKKCFQYRRYYNGHDYYIGLETIFEYEHITKLSFSESTREALMNEIEDDDFTLTPLENRLVIQDVEDFFKSHQDEALDTLAGRFAELARKTGCGNEEHIILIFNELKDFLQVKPRLPGTDKQFVPFAPRLQIDVSHSRQEILQIISDLADDNEVALLSLYAYRQMDKIDWKPFLKAALERNPVSLAALKGYTPDDAYDAITGMPDESVYDGKRLAQPDEVWNFGRGDGIEKAVLFANFLRHEMKAKDLYLTADGETVILQSDRKIYTFHSQKNLEKQMILP